MRAPAVSFPLVPLLLTAAAVTAPIDAQTQGSLRILPQPASCGALGRIDSPMAFPSVFFPFSVGGEWNYRAAGQASAWLLIDGGGPAWNGGLPPQPFGPLFPSLAGCDQMAAADLVVAAPVVCSVRNLCVPPQPPCPIDVCSTATTLALPRDRALIGVPFRMQWLLVDVSPVGVALRTTSALEVRFGG